MDTFFIWSRRHNQWWGPDHSGYSDTLNKAGLYDAEEAASIMLNALPGQNIAIDKHLALSNQGESVDDLLEQWRNF